MAKPSSKPGRDWASHPSLIHPPYMSSRLRGPTKPLVPLATSLSHRTGPVFGHNAIARHDNDLTKNASTTGNALGERIIVTGRVRDADGRPVPNSLIEIWQANAAGRYAHKVDQHDAPLDPNFFGGGRCLTDADGRYRFYTIKPGAYPWGNHDNAWRPNHIHLSLLGPSMESRLVTQMYFPGDPLLDLDPIYLGVPTAARSRLVSSFSIEVTEAGFALGYVFDIVLSGSARTPMES
ncbi:MAG: protocatechuate 3,4-dioxygenase subunit beta [Aestuariivirgaceae bacterium]